MLSIICFPVTIERGKKAKPVVLEHLLTNRMEFQIEYTKHGNPKPQSYDQADAIVMALAGQQIIDNNLDNDYEAC